MANAETMIRVPPVTPERQSGVIGFDEIEEPAVRAGFEHWAKLKGARQYPARSEISPREIASLLRNTVLLRVVDGGADYEFRIVGDAHVLAHGYSMQGRKLSQIGEHSPGYDAVLRTLYDPVVKTHTPFALRGWLMRGETQKQYIYTESVFLPLGPNSATVDHVLNFSVYIPQEQRG